VAGQSIGGIGTNGFRMLLTGIRSNSYRTEYSSNWSNWIPLQTNQLTDGEATVLDRGATNAPRRFYRARLLP
jgi:hypothetical protein